VRSATTSLRGLPASVPEARRWTIRTLTAWGLDVTAWTAAQVVSELVTNCTLHARSDFSLRLVLDGDVVRVEATDDAPGGLHARQYSSTSTTGRGLRIVETLATSWGVVPSGNGKTVWAVLPLEDPLPTRDGDEDGDEGAQAPPAGVQVPSPSGPLARTAAA
jgi:anti-sigma regulatory factor (Ser/Thr protein kinase)